MKNQKPQKHPEKPEQKTYAKKSQYQGASSKKSITDNEQTTRRTNG